MKRSSVDRLEFLKESHRYLDHTIANAHFNRLPDYTIADLKKKKLSLKDQIAAMENDLGIREMTTEERQRAKEKAQANKSP
jgi:uncharacterized protein YdcH (DUF465 family)